LRRDPHIAYTTSLPANAFLESTYVQRRAPAPVIRLARKSAERVQADLCSKQVAQEREIAALYRL
jgi:hypothetical protein